MGGLGWHCVERVRTPIMLVALGCSLAAWIFILGATFGVSYNSYTIKRLSWARIHWTDERNLVELTIDIGINMYVYQISGVNRTNGRISYDPEGYLEQSVNWADDDACKAFDDLLEEQSKEDLETFCDQCQDTAARTMTFIIMSICLQVLQIKKNLQRLTPFGDMNCQKFNGWVGSLASLTTGSISIASWLQGCWNHFPNTIVFLVADPRTGEEIQTTTDPRYGRGCALMTAAVALKLVDCVCHFILQTPAKKRGNIRENISMEEYCLLCDEPTNFGQPVHRARGKSAQPVEASLASSPRTGDAKNHAV